MKRFLIGTVALLSACAGGNSAPVSFSVSTRSAAASSRALVVAGSIDIQRVRINVGRLKLEGPAAAASSVAVPREGSDDDGGDGGESGEIEVRQGPFVLDLDAAALNGAITRVFDADVAAGTYREFRLDILPSAALQNASVIVDGTVDSQPFTFTSSLEATQQKEGSFVVGGSTANITLSIDPAGWFGTAAARLDPRVAANRAAIESNLRRSIDVFQDDDGSGHENHHDDHGGHEDGGTDGGHT